MSKGSRDRTKDFKSFMDSYERIFARKGKGAKGSQVHTDKKREAKKRGQGGDDEN